MQNLDLWLCVYPCVLGVFCVLCCVYVLCVVLCVLCVYVCVCLFVCVCLYLFVCMCLFSSHCNLILSLFAASIVFIFLQLNPSLIQLNADDDNVALKFSLTVDFEGKRQCVLFFAISLSVEAGGRALFFQHGRRRTCWLLCW